MSRPGVRADPEPYREVVSAVDRCLEEAGEPRSRVAGQLYAGLLLAVRRLAEFDGSGGRAVPGP